MAKGWTKLNTVNDVPKDTRTRAEKSLANKRQGNFLRATKSLSTEELKKQNEEHYAEKIAKEENLILAFEEKQLKSKELIKQALKLKKDKEKKAAEAAAKAQKEVQKKDTEPAPAE